MHLYESVKHPLLPKKTCFSQDCIFGSADMDVSKTGKEKRKTVPAPILELILENIRAKFQKSYRKGIG